MKSIRILSVSIFILFSYSSFCQKETERQLNPDSTVILDKKKTLQTDIFILNTCEPNQLSIVKMYDDYRQIHLVNKRRLSISTNKFSSFKIININPNRYIYNINNTLITQFMDSNPYSPNINTFINGTALPVSEIEIIELFKGYKNQETKRGKIGKIKKEIDSLSTVIQIASIQMEDLKNDLNQTKDDGKKKEILKQFNDIQSNKYTVSVSKYNSALSDYSSMVSALIINESSLLENFENLIYDTLIKSKDLRKAVESIFQLAKNLQEKNSNLEIIKNKIIQFSSENFENLNNYSFVGTASQSSLYSFEEADFDPETELSKLGYKINMRNIKASNPTYQLLEITKMNEFISEKKINEWELFVLNTSKELGKLLQAKIVEYSEQKNIIAQQTCIDNEFTNEINKYSQDLRNNFIVIRNICADLNVLIKSLELNDAGFGSIVDGVNTNYIILKKYLTFMDFTSKNNTLEFTLPTHTNLKNVDLIRYQITREDILTHSRQSYEYDIWIKGGLKIDFSAGIFATSLVDYKFEKLQAASKSDPSITLDDSIYVNRINTGNYDLAFGAMVNISIRTGASWFIPGISFGTAYAMNKKLQFLGAFSMQLGKTERLILHGGVAAGLATTLNLAALNYNREYENDGGKHYLVKGKYEDFNIPTIEKFSFKPFFGISYNLSKKNALSAASNSYNYSPTNSSVEVEPEETK